MNYLPYVPDPETMRAVRSEKLLEQDASVYDAWAKTAVEGRRDVPIADSKTKRPLVFLCPGQGMPIFSYTNLATQLASDGYIVAACDFGSGGFLVQDGKLLHEDPAGDDEATFGKIADDWAAQISEVLSCIQSGSEAGSSESARAVLACADLGKVGVIGHSIGGAAALEAARIDPRIRACVNLDGIPLSYVADHGISTTCLFLRSHVDYSDEDLQRLHRTREQWNKRGAEIMATMKQMLASPGGEAWIVSVDGTNHMSYSDAPFTMPKEISRWGGKYLDPKRLQLVEVQLIESYLNNRFLHQAFPDKLATEAHIQVARAK